MLLYALLSCSPSAEPSAEPVVVASVVPAVTPAPGASAWVDGIPHIVQKPDFCGEACLAMAMAGRGVPVDQDAIFDLSGLDPAEGRGVWARELVVAARALGFEPGPIWSSYDEQDRDAPNAALEALIADLREGVPSIVCMHFDERPDTTEHFRLITGYDAAADELRYHDPALERGADLRMSRARFLALWPLRKDEHTLSLIRLALRPVDLKAPEPTTGVTAADLAQAVRAAREKIGQEKGFTILVQSPWVVVGDGGPAEVRRLATGTVAWTSAQLRAAYFPRELDEVWTVWLFDTDESYTDHAMAYFGDYPGTPYGYADGDERALVMNIGTGGGTLVHEMVHPYMQVNLPDCPAWMNEGLASLYEHVGAVDGQIHGFVNWRLPGLQRAIRGGTLPSLRWLTAATPEQFYDPETSGTHYAMSRYLMQYLQDQGKLRAFMAAYSRDRAKDPGGYQTLLDTLQVTDVPAFTATWEQWALSLRWPT